MYSLKIVLAHITAIMSGTEVIAKQQQIRIGWPGLPTSTSFEYRQSHVRIILLGFCWKALEGVIRHHAESR